tara:strand:+ start:1343 stop:1615 length:273 start_codon:yes stop_codon:yes gene_type:complete
MKLKSKSSLFHTIIGKVDQQLASIPLHDSQGTPLEDSTDFDMHVDGIKGLKLTNPVGKIVHPFSTTIATELVYDELFERREQGNGDKWRE